MNKEKKQSPLSRLLEYAGSYKKLTFIRLFLSGISMICGMIPYVCIWLVLRKLIKAAPDFASASGIASYGWIAFGAAVGGILVLKDGRVAEEGSPEELKRKEGSIFSHMLQLQTEGAGWSI